MKKTYLLIICVSVFTANAQQQWPEINGGVRVVDEAGRPIVNAKVSVWFDTMATSNVFDGTKTESVWGSSDKNGEFCATHSALGEFGGGIQENGYYISQNRVRLANHKDGKWIPWHQVIELKVRKIEAPIPMYAKRLHYFDLPTTNSPVGYDLMAGDWVSPHGKGSVTDVIITPEFVLQEGSGYRWKLTLQGAKEGDGFSPISPDQESPQSQLRFPRTAPTDGYSINPVIIEFKYGKGKSEYTRSAGATNFFFRVRTELDENKQVKKALYGKLIGPIEAQFHYVKTGKLNFTYYLNPTPLDRNMEFDLKKNLFQKLPSMEHVNAP